MCFGRWLQSNEFSIDTDTHRKSPKALVSTQSTLGTGRFSFANIDTAPRNHEIGSVDWCNSHSVGPTPSHSIAGKLIWSLVVATPNDRRADGEQY